MAQNKAPRPNGLGRQVLWFRLGTGSHLPVPLQILPSAVHPWRPRLLLLLKCQGLHWLPGSPSLHPDTPAPPPGPPLVSLGLAFCPGGSRPLFLASPEALPSTQTQVPCWWQQPSAWLPRVPGGCLPQELLFQEDVESPAATAGRPSNTGSPESWSRQAAGGPPELVTPWPPATN